MDPLLDRINLRWPFFAFEQHNKYINVSLYLTAKKVLKEFHKKQ